jgi:molybdopterin molybdotransferase
VLSVVEAADRVVAGVAPLPVAEVPLREALGLVLARDVVSPVTLPHRDNSAMDGYAARAADVLAARADAPVVLAVVETVAAGAMPTRALGPGECARVMTGAPLPVGADTVVRQEDTDQGVARVAVREARDAGRNVRPRGEDLRAGDVVLTAGTALGPAQLGVLAACGQARIPVHRRARVALVSSGDELVDLDRFDEVLAGRRIVSSNAYTLHALVTANGGVPLDLGTAPDDPAALRGLLARGRDEADLVITSAGISVGAHDHVKAVLAELGGALDFWKVRMRPGAPLGFGRLDATPWVGLPGNPVSAMVTFELFARAALRRMHGHAAVHRRPVAVVLEERVTIGAPLTHFYRAVVTPRADGRLGARLTGPQGSGILTSMARANALLVVPEGHPVLDVGATAAALLLDDTAGATATPTLEAS